MPRSTDLLQGTLDLLVLKTLQLEPMHGWGISQRIRQISGDLLQVQQGSLYPALHRLENQGLIDAAWGASDANRRARYYRITRKGRKRLAAEESTWQKFSLAIARILAATAANSAASPS